MINAISISEPISAENKVYENQQIIPETSITEGDLTFRNCTISNVNATINNCRFENCKIDCAGLTNCTLVNCEIAAYDIGITNCSIENPQMVNATRCAVTTCSFFNIVCDNEGIIFIEDSKVVNCIFANVELRNGAYLISGIGDCCVSNCKFDNCATERGDLQIVYCEDTTGKFIKKTKEYDIVESDCIGLDNVKPL